MMKKIYACNKTMWPAEMKIMNMLYRGSITIHELITQVIDDNNIVDTGDHGNSTLSKPLDLGGQKWKPHESLLPRIKELKQEYLQTPGVTAILSLMNIDKIGGDRMKIFIEFLLTTFTFSKISFSQVCQWLMKNTDFPNPLNLTYFTNYTEWTKIINNSLHGLDIGFVIRVNDDIFIITTSAGGYLERVEDVTVWNKDKKTWNIKYDKYSPYRPTVSINGENIKTFQYLTFKKDSPGGFGPFFSRIPKNQDEFTHLTDLLSKPKVDERK